MDGFKRIYLRLGLGQTASTSNRRDEFRHLVSASQWYAADLDTPTSDILGTLATHSSPIVNTVSL